MEWHSHGRIAGDIYQGLHLMDVADHPLEILGRPLARALRSQVLVPPLEGGTFQHAAAMLFIPRHTVLEPKPR